MNDIIKARRTKEVKRWNADTREIVDIDTTNDADKDFCSTIALEAAQELDNRYRQYVRRWKDEKKTR